MRWLRLVLMLTLPIAAFAQTPEGQSDKTTNSPEKALEGSKLGAMLGGLEPVIQGAEETGARVVAQPPSELPALELTVTSAVDLALQNSPTVSKEEWDVQAAKARARMARSPMLPQVSTGVVWTRVEGLDDSRGGLLGNLVGGGNLTPDKTTRTDSLSVDQLLFAGGSVHAAMKAAEYLAQSQDWQREAAINELVYETRKAFYDCLLAEALVSVAQDSVTTFTRHEQDTRQMLDVGVVSDYELLRAQTELGNRNSDLVAAQNGLRLAKANLRRLLSVPQDTPVHIVGQLAWKPLETPVDELVATAQDRRPELLALRKALAAASEDVNRTKGDYFPRVAAHAEWRNVDGGGAASPDGWTFSVGAKWDIYTGGKRKNAVAEAEAKQKSLEYQEAQLSQLIELDVHQAYIQVQDAIAKIRSEKGTVELGAEGQRLAMLRFQEGVGTQSETLDAELALTTAERGLVQAVRDYAVAYAALDKAIGQRQDISDPAVSIEEGAPLP